MARQTSVWTEDRKGGTKWGSQVFTTGCHQLRLSQPHHKSNLTRYVPAAQSYCDTSEQGGMLGATQDQDGADVPPGHPGVSWLRVSRCLLDLEVSGSSEAV